MCIVYCTTRTFMVMDRCCRISGAFKIQFKWCLRCGKLEARPSVCFFFFFFRTNHFASLYLYDYYLTAILHRHPLHSILNWKSILFPFAQVNQYLNKYLRPNTLQFFHFQQRKFFFSVHGIRRMNRGWNEHIYRGECKQENSNQFHRDHQNAHVTMIT